jgi:hypothetical protein
MLLLQRWLHLLLLLSCLEQEALSPCPVRGSPCALAFFDLQ